MNNKSDLFCHEAAHWRSTVSSLHLRLLLSLFLFLSPSLSLQNIIAEHEIRNISCAAQDPEDLSTFAYITKDLKSSHHYCHVFTAFDVVSADAVATRLKINVIIAAPITSQMHSRLFAFTLLSELGV